MKALRFHAARDLRIEDVAEPPPPVVGEVCFRVATCGICGTDLHEYVAGPIVTPVEPHPLTGAKNPQILGHEFSGEVVAVGPGVTSVAVGDRVAMMPLAYCGHCAVLPPRSAAPLRDHGLRRPLTCLGRDGGVCDGRRVPGRSASRGGQLPAGGADRADGGRRLRRRTGRRRPGDRVLVTGAGPIGALAALCARVGRRVHRLRLGAERGTPRAGRGARRGDGARSDGRRRPRATSTRRRDGLGVDVAIECSGHPNGFSTRRSARCAEGARSLRPGCSSARRRSSRCSGRSTT